MNYTTKRRDTQALKYHIADQEFDLAKNLFGLTEGRNSREHNQPCPICRDGTDRFWFNPEKRTFHCRKCGFGGDIIALAEKVFGLQFSEAFDKIADTAGYADGVTHISQPIAGVMKTVQEGRSLPHFEVFPLDANSPVFKATAKYRPDISFDDYQRAGAKLFQAGIAIPMFDNEGTLSGWVRYLKDGTKKNSFNSKSGIVGIDTIRNLQSRKPAKAVFKTAGVSDYLALQGMISRLGFGNDYYAFTNGAGESEKPDKFEPLLRQALEGKTVVVIQDNDEAGEAGALRWAESFAGYAQAFRGFAFITVGLP